MKKLGVLARFFGTGRERPAMMPRGKRKLLIILYRIPEKGTRQQEFDNRNTGFFPYFLTSLPSFCSMEAILDSSLPDLPSL